MKTYEEIWNEAIDQCANQVVVSLNLSYAHSRILDLKKPVPISCLHKGEMVIECTHPRARVLNFNYCPDCGLEMPKPKPVPKPESMSDLTEARLGILESDLERFFEGNGGLCGDDFRCLKRLISEVRRWREEHVTAFEHGIRTEARIQLREPKPHVHEWKEDLLERLRNCDWMQTCSICSCGATKVEQITEPK